MCRSLPSGRFGETLTSVLAAPWESGRPLKRHSNGRTARVAMASLSTRLPVHMPEQSGESGEGGPVRPELPSRTQTAVMKRGDAVLGVNSPKGN